jgi:hypothetical protein
MMVFGIDTIWKISKKIRSFGIEYAVIIGFFNSLNNILSKARENSQKIRQKTFSVMAHYRALLNFFGQFLQDCAHSCQKMK